MVMHSNLSKMKHKILPTCLQGNSRDSLGEFSNTSHGVCRAERVKPGFYERCSNVVRDGSSTEERKRRRKMEIFRSFRLRFHRACPLFQAVFTVT